MALALQLMRRRLRPQEQPQACPSLSLLLRPRGGVRRGIHGGEGREHDDDTGLVAGSLYNVRRQQQRDARS